MADSPRGIDHTDSMDSNDGGPKQPDKKKSRRPANTAFRQQRLKAWQPILTPKTVLPLFFVIGIIFAPIGGLLLYASAQVQEIRLDYTDCKADAPILSRDLTGFGDMPGDTITTAFKNSSGDVNAQWGRRVGVNVSDAVTNVAINTTRCYLRFTIPEDMGSPVLFYYHLTNFYQNHRRYVESFDNSQLKGNKRSYDQIKGSDCSPLYGDKEEKLPYYPCGLIANSMFNDTFSYPVLLNPPNAKRNETRTYTMTTKDEIAWSSDKDLYGETDSKYDEVLPPPNWRERYPDGYTKENPPPNLKEWPAFQVWMRTAGLPVFSKLYQRNNTDKMTAGRYEVIVDDYFPTTLYKGTKSIIITTRTVMGGRNPFLGIAYVVVGGVCILLGTVFTVTHLIRPRKLGDHTYLSWNNAPGAKSGPSTATASGRELRPGEA
ncbi:ligand-effect modulator 3 family [Dactylonectria estremocensis]|uniref:Ligand-effect modulator 3 family n=1 Tax=Dactylonectria estremocensis TaxID=1079267 RepID=A0A9P9EZS5_9HYPO|nr:ligand-effect modulator 3 family [Dactylonectria estremocensis]